MNITPIGTIRNTSTYKVDGATVIHATGTAALPDKEIIHCVSCGSRACMHADALRSAMLLSLAEKIT